MNNISLDLNNKILNKVFILVRKILMKQPKIKEIKIKNNKYFKKEITLKKKNKK